MDEAKKAEVQLSTRRAVVEYEIPEYHSAEMGKVIQDLEKVVSFVPMREEELDSTRREAHPYLTSQMDYDAELSGPHPNVTRYERLRDTMPYIIVANKQLVLSYRESLKQISPSG